MKKVISLFLAIAFITGALTISTGASENYYPDTPSIETEIAQEFQDDEVVEEAVPEFAPPAEHNRHEYVAKLVPNTHSSEGYTVYSCFCGDTYSSDTVPVGHNWDTGIYTVLPTETKSGLRTYTCLDCGETKTGTISPLGDLEELFKNVVGGFDSFYKETNSSMAYYYLAKTNRYFIGEWGAHGFDPYGVQGDKYEQYLKVQFNADDEIINTLRNCNSYELRYDAESHTYTLTELGGMGGLLNSRGYLGYVKNGETYDVFFCNLTYTNINDVLSAEGKTVDDLIGDTYQHEIEYNGVVYKNHLGDYLSAKGENYGIKYTVETTDSVRILSYAQYTESDLPENLNGEHEHNYDKSVSDPTCYFEGYITYDCDCGDSYVDNFIPALGHSWNNGDVTKYATEENPGVKIFTCINCGETKTEEISVLPHTHTYESTVISPTCTENGYTVHNCRCGDKYTDTAVKATGHNYRNWTEIKAPTYTKAGEEKRECTNCGNTETRDISALVKPTYENKEVIYDIPKDSIVRIPANNCFGKDTVVKVEEIFSGSFFEKAVNTMEKIADKFAAFEFTATKNNTVVQPNGKLIVTFVIPDNYSDNVSVFYMDANGALEKIKSTVNTAERTVTAELEHFSTYIMADVEKSSHQHVYKTQITEPTCAEDGYTAYTCDCGDTYKDNKVSAVEHSFGEWTLINTPEAIESDEEKRECANCGHLEIRTASAVSGVSGTTGKVEGKEDSLSENATSSTDTEGTVTPTGNTGLIIASVIISAIAVGAVVVFIVIKKRKA